MQLVWEGNWLHPNGHATVTRNILTQLDAMGVEVKLRSTQFPNPTSLIGPGDGLLLRMATQRYERGTRRVRIIHRSPRDFHREDDVFTVGFTYAESTRVPSFWVGKINREVDALAVGSEFSRDAFLKSGVRRPIWVIPHAVDTSVFHPGRPSRHIADIWPGFRFLSVFEWAPRKGPDILLRAFWEEFSKEDDVCLIIKTKSSFGKETGNSRRQLQHLIRRYRPKNAAPVWVYDGNLKEAQMVSLYQNASAFVLPTHGEGVGFPILEAASCGIPILVTRFGGHVERLVAHGAYYFSHRMEPIPSSVTAEWASLRGAWATPSVASVRDVMRRVYRNPGEASLRAKRVHSDLRPKLQWELAAKELVHRVSVAVGRDIL